MNLRYAVLSMLVPVAFGLAPAGAQTPEQSLENHGYPHVLKTIHFKPGHARTVRVPDQFTQGKPPGYATFSVPANAFKKPVTIRFLAARNSRWDRQVANDQKVIANFAYRVTDAKTGAVVNHFNAPIMYSVQDSMVAHNSRYLATTPDKQPRLIQSDKAARIEGKTLSHPTATGRFGWIITTPRSELSMGSMNGSNQAMKSQDSMGQGSMGQNSMDDSKTSGHK